MTSSFATSSRVVGDLLDVVVIGNAGIDTNVFLPGADIDFGREANFTENVDYVGQAGGFSARGYARLGLRSGFIGHVGDDHNGRLVRETLAADGIDIRALFADPAGTARSVNIMHGDGRRKNFYDGKSHMTLRPDAAFCRRVMAGARLAHVHLPNWARELLPVAHELGLTIAVDIQDVVDPDDPYRQDFIRYADILFCSAVNHANPAALATRLLERRPELIIVMGLGAEGCMLATAAGASFYPPVSLPRPVVDTNGAGDALAVGFLSSYVFYGYDLEESVLRGQVAARHTCALRATSDGLITRGELDRWVRTLRPG